MSFHVKVSLICTLSPFSGLNHDFVMHIGFTHVAASNTATDDVTN